MNTTDTALTVELERNRVDSIKEARDKRRLAEVNVAPQIDGKGIEQFPAASRVSTGEIECITCTAIINVNAPQRTCPACATKWRKAIGDDWYTQDWHVELLGQHKELYADNAVNRALPMSFHAEQVTEQIEQYDEKPLRVSPQYREVYLVVTAIRELKGYGRTRVAEELREINKKRAEIGAESLPIPSTDTLTRWCGDVEDSGPKEFVIELAASGLGARRIKAKLVELNLEVPGLATISRWICESLDAQSIKAVA